MNTFPLHILSVAKTIRTVRSDELRNKLAVRLAESLIEDGEMTVADEPGLLSLCGFRCLRVRAHP